MHLENRIEASRNVSSLNNNKLLNLVNNCTDHDNANSRGDYDEDYYDDEYDQSREHIEISTLKNQREELREVVSKLSSSYNYELKLAQEKIKNLELKVQDMNSINNKLSQRLEPNRTISSGQNNHNNTSNSPLRFLAIIKEENYKVLQLFLLQRSYLTINWYSISVRISMYIYKLHIKI